ncbi:hypothetical protein TELCIR_11730 [Teladorsagia circumcincta]|uniref:Uncharacterized protein n=1 Tax=Teladorsagia circumcincta TaxID=45464 RepID=A0A2G9U8R4_TELCI|nr:hypothetical protein TELCIR_11730 [Teladorsagia circumcincta]
MSICLLINYNRMDMSFPQFSLPKSDMPLKCSPLLFADFPIAPESIFYRSAYSFAFVNVKPVVNGRECIDLLFLLYFIPLVYVADVLVCPKRVCNHLTDLTDAETADLFIVCKKVQRMIEKFSS